MPSDSVAAWSAPKPGAPVRGQVSVPASKSLTNRYLLLAALAEGPSVVINPLESRDTQLMLSALEALGAGVERLSNWGESREHAVRITPAAVPRTDHELVPIECGLAGTVMRFVPAVAALHGGRIRFDGDPEARTRPMDAVLNGLQALGVDVAEEGQPGFLPFTIDGQGHVPGGEITIDASGSSQFVSGLLLAAARFEEGLTLHHSGAQVPSSEHVEMTLAVLEQVGVHVSADAPHTWRVEQGPIRPFTVRVEPDLSNAGPFLCAAAVTAGEVTMSGWPRHSTQIGRRWPQLLKEFGCEVTLADEPAVVAGAPATAKLTVTGPAELRSPGAVDGTAELTPTVAAIAALCAQPTKFTSVAHLRGHETDRIAALVTEIRRLGGSAEETADGFVILAPVSRGAVVRSYADHRMATFAAVLGLAVDQIYVEDIGCTSKTMPNFSERWRSLVGP